jgi:hypothetical protein
MCHLRTLLVWIRQKQSYKKLLLGPEKGLISILVLELLLELFYFMVLRVMEKLIYAKLWLVNVAVPLSLSLLLPY